MQFRSSRPELEHFAGHDDLPLVPAQLPDKPDHFGQGFGIGVVRIIDDRESFLELHNLPALVFRFHSGNSAAHVVP